MPKEENISQEDHGKEDQIDHEYDYPIFPEISDEKQHPEKKEETITEVITTKGSKTKQNLFASTHNKNTEINNQKGSSDIDEENVYEAVPDYPE